MFSKGRVVRALEMKMNVSVAHMELLWQSFGLFHQAVAPFLFSPPTHPPPCFQL